MPSATSWTSFFRTPCEAVVPPCGDMDCSSTRRLWRRFRWRHGTIRLHDALYCAPSCFETAARQRFARLCVTTVPARSVRHRVPLGLLMISRGQLTNQQLRSALEVQRGNGRRRLGEWLEQLGFATEPQVTAALAQQWACPVLASKAICDPACLRLLPYHLLETSRILPVQFVSSTRIFHLSFCDGIDYSALYAIEQMLDCRTQACLASRSAVAQALESVGHERHPGELLFEGWRDAAEMARITCAYVLKLGAEAVRIVGCAGFIWARLSSGPDIANLLFRRPAEASHGSGLELDAPSVPLPITR
jgi:hypothetical protein